MQNYRTAEQLAEMQRLDADGICLFCPEGLRWQADQGRPGVLWETKHWIVRPNEFPYSGTQLHLLLIPRDHVGDVLDLGAAAQADFWTALGWVRDRYQLTYYGLGMRNGDCRYTGATIRHVHAHVLVGDPTTEPEIPVRLRLSSRPVDEPPDPSKPS
jgi:ATP adenylyltransferase